MCTKFGLDSLGPKFFYSTDAQTVSHTHTHTHTQTHKVADATDHSTHASARAGVVNRSKYA